MKITISVPDDVFNSAERLARRTRRSRSQLFSDAMKEYLARHSLDEVTEAMNRVYDQIGSRCDDFTAAATRCVLQRTEW